MRLAISGYMNATPRLSIPAAASEPARSSSSAAPSSAQPDAKTQDFAAALCDVGAKPARKAGERKTTDTGADGGQLPPPGNPSPPQTATPDAAAAAAGAAGNASALPAGTARGAGSADAASAHGARPVAAAAPGAQGSAPGAGADPPATQAASGALPDRADTLAGFMLPGDLPPGGAPAAGGEVPALPVPAAQAGAVQGGAGAAGASHNHSVGTAQNAAAAKDPATGSASIKQVSKAEATAAFKAATSGSSAAGGAGAGQSGPADAAAAQAAAGAQTAAAAAAQSTAAAGVVVVAPDFANSKDSQASSDIPAAGTGSAASGAPGSPGVPLSAVHAAAAAAAAPPAMNAQALAALGEAGGSDQRAHGHNGDSLPGVSGDGLAGAVQSGLNAPGTVAGAAPTLRVAAAVDTQDFGQSLADRVSYMIGNNLNGAKLQVNPPQLGPIEVRIAVQGDHAQVWLTSHSAVTRDALEASTPRLRDMLGAQGFGQVSVDVSQRSFQDRSPQPQHYNWTPAAVRDISPVSAAASVSSPRLSNSAVDAYA